MLEFGSEAQRLEHLPPICRGEIRWCQGYSEPSAGSDLAALTTRGVRQGDEFVLNGQKIWTSYADLSDWIFCLVRTDPNAKKQAGISFMLVDMETPGVSTKRIKLISGASPFCEVFFDEVRVPMKNVVAELNAGWTVAKALLGYERSMIGEAMGGQLAGAAEALVTLARSACKRPRPLQPCAAKAVRFDDRYRVWMPTSNRDASQDRMRQCRLDKTKSKRCETMP